MTTTDIRVETARPAKPPAAAGGRPSATVLAVVGLDGSRPSLAALEAATQLIRGRAGHLEIVYVAHIPGYAALSPAALVGIRETSNAIAAELADTAHAVLDDREPRWHFQRRDGSIADELLAAATELRRQHGPDAVIVIIVGAAEHLLHHVASSLALPRAHDEQFSVLVVPAKPLALPVADPADTSTYLG